MNSVLYVDATNGISEAPKASTLSNPASWFVDWATGGKAESGAAVNWQTASGLSAFWYCVNRISNDVAQMPMRLYERGKDGTNVEDFTHPAGQQMRVASGSVISPFHIRKTLQQHACAVGNGRAYIVRNGRNEPIDLLPLGHDEACTVLIYSSELGRKEKWHVVYDDQTNERIPFPDSDCLHIYGYSEDGYQGMPVLKTLANVFGTGLATEKTVARFFKNNAVPGIVLEAPPGAFRTAEDAQAFLQKWNDYHAGLDNTARAGLLREGIKANTLTMSWDKAQMIGQREFQVKELMRVFGIPMIPGISESSSYNTLEQLNRAYLLHCLGPWLRIWEQECNRKLLTSSEVRNERYYFEFDSWELVKPDAAQRADMLTKLVSGMIITSNEARSWEGLAPLPGGDELRNPATTTEPASGETDEEDTEDEDAEDDSEDASIANQRKLIAAKLMPLVNAERRRVKEMAGKARNFVDWLESYYGKHEPRVISAVVSLGGEGWMGTEYVEHSKYLLLEAAGTATSENLSTMVDKTMEAWPARAEELSRTILEGYSNGQ